MLAEVKSYDFRKKAHHFLCSFVSAPHVENKKIIRIIAEKKIFQILPKQSQGE